MTTDIDTRIHKEWLGFLQPVGLVVSPPALSAAQAVVNRNVVELQQTLQSIASPQTIPDREIEEFCLTDFPQFAINVLGWEENDLVDSPPELAISLQEYNEILAPTYAVPHPDGGWLLLIKILPPGTT